ncbi:MAG: cytochrome c oxidase accessory protein CcoG [Pseudomonadales bacterium]|nr:cytochrome c oxidase accessory protein CcoG [Pseudomonadales bacterium]MCP5182633.1 cytochrome c oxidase accessory protein CcoG [Pseudomonadales bacterium]
MNGNPNGNSPQVDVEETPVQLVGFGPVDLYQKREKIFTRYVGGVFQRLRFYTGWPLLVGYFGLPWLNWGDRQAILFDLPARQFNIFGLTIWPQDLWLLGWMLMIAAFGLFTITTIVGRLWCGYTCPQTVWTAIFMWMEQVAEGPRHVRMRLDSAPWTWEKLRKRTFKHAMWLGWAFLTGLTFVGYFTPIRELVVDLPLMSAGLAATFWTLFFTAATYVNAGWMREQVCIYMCPYARFQSAMIDKDTLIVSYDAKRGEPRGSRKRNATDHGLGDCTDCQLCVQVCPTGIDIRNGLQYQCIGCAHCIDACAEVMQKMGYAPGLVRYTTLRALEGGKVHPFRARSIGYAGVCLLLITAFGIAAFNRSLLTIDVLRARDTLYRETADGQIRNDYQLVLGNKTQQETEYVFRLLRPDTLTLDIAQHVRVAAGGIENIPFELVGTSDTPNTSATIEACVADGSACATEETRYITPMTGGAR